MGSSRLPGKVMLHLEGQPMLAHKILRVKRSQLSEDLKVLTTVHPMNQIIEDFCLREGYKVFRGSEDDILERILQGTAKECPDIIVQLTGDNPALDPGLIDDTVQYLIDNDLDLASNSITQNILTGMNVRCFKREALMRANKICLDPMMRIHGGYYIQANPDQFKVGECPVDLEYLRDDIRLTVDEPADFELMRIVFNKLLLKNINFTVDDVVSLFNQCPELSRINQHVMQKKVGEG